MKNSQLESVRNLVVIHDSSLNKYNGVVLFPKKVAKMEKMLEKVGLPDFIEKKLSKKP